MAKVEALAPAGELARHGIRFPNESDDYRRARTALLAEEIELRRHIERVAEQRRALPPGGEVPEDYLFEGEAGPARLSDLFAGKQTLVVYNWMYGPSGRARCAPRSSRRSPARRRTSSSGSGSRSSRARRSRGSSPSPTTTASTGKAWSTTIGDPSSARYVGHQREQSECRRRLEEGRAKSSTELTFESLVVR
jgi:hypothetical protein